jgi:hypothetical protein
MRQAFHAASVVALLAISGAACSDTTSTSTPTDASGADADGAVTTDATADITSSDADANALDSKPIDALADVPTKDADAASDATLDAESDTTSSADGAVASGVHVAIPMYVDPSDSPALWTEVYAGAPTVGLLVANLDNGPGTAVDADYTAAVTSAHAAGELVIGYVHTTSAGRAIADVEADVDAWYAFYPTLDGIFVDEVSSDASTVASYYLPLYTHIKSKAAKSTVAINPGTMVDESFMTASDILITFEDVYADFIDPTQNPPNPAWVATYPASRFWTLILSADPSVEANAITLARGRNAGWIYVTSEGPATAYQNIETGTYWTNELTDVSAP